MGQNSWQKEALGVKIDDISLHTALATVDNWISSFQGVPKSIVTVNPEFVVAAQRNAHFRDLINSSDLSVPDGIGLRLTGIKNRVPGPDLTIALCHLAAAKGWTVGLFGGSQGVAQRSVNVLEKKAPGMRIVYALDGQNADEIKEELIVSPESVRTKLGCVDLLVVALGMIKQEEFMMSLGQATDNEKLGNAYGVAIGVGGALDFISGNVPRAPKALRAIGLEWLFRLAIEPRRIRRTARATLVFPMLVLNEKLGRRSIT